jgi:hypothetical protein
MHVPVHTPLSFSPLLLLLVVQASPICLLMICGKSFQEILTSELDMFALLVLCSKSRGPQWRVCTLPKIAFAYGCVRTYSKYLRARRSADMHG